VVDVKGVNVLFAAVFVMMISIAGIAIVLNMGMPAVEKTKTYVEVTEAVSILNLLENVLNEVASGGIGTKRILDFSSSGEFTVLAEEDAIEFQVDSLAQIFDYFSRKIRDNVMYIAGNDVSCDDTGSLTIENSFIKVVFNKTSEQSPMSSIDTTRNILMLQEKTNNNTIYPVNTSVVIDGDPSTSRGNGYSELLRKGNNLPECTAHFFINSTKQYDVYYTLYAGADFLSVEIRNIK